MHFRLNGQPFTTYQVQYFANRLGFIEFNFGLLKPGDQLQVYDDCGSTPYAVTVSDDFVYVEVPNGQSYTGNSIPPGDESSPYGRLSTPVEVGKCEPVTIGAHGLHNYGIFVSTNTKGTPVTIGKFSINGQPLRTQGNIISHIGYENPVNYTVSSAGGVTFDGPVKFTSQAFYSGQTPVTIEYQHNGAVYDGDLDLSIGGLSFRYVKNTGFSVQKATYTSSVTQTDYAGNYSHSVFRITYDGQYFKAYVDNVLVETLARFVVYEANGGTLTQTGVLPYGATTTFTPTQSGSGWVGVLVDGVLYTRQQFKIADDLSINPTVTNVSCAGASTGKISVAATGGKAPLQYQLNTGGYSAGSTFTGLAAGTYTISVRDASGCIQTRTVTISQLPALSATISSQTDASCRDKQDGSVTIAVAGGTAPYQYATNGTTVGSANTLTGLSAGQYQIRVTDASGCVKTLPLTIGTRSQLSASLGTVQHVACQGGATGSITISTAGSQPVGPLRFSIDGIATGQNTPQFTGLPAGSYTIRVNDDLCSVAVTASLTEPTALQATATISKPITCYNAPTGVVIVSGAGGTSPYTYSADNSLFGSGNQFSGLAAGSYKYWLKDANGCTAATAIVTLSQPAALAAAITNRQDATCSGSATGSLTVQAGGGTTPYAYSRNGIDFYPSGQFSGLAATSYTLVVRDAGGCSATTTASIGQPTVLTAVVASQQPITCAGGTDGRISVAATGGTAPYTYALGTTPFASTSTFATLQEGTYTVGIRDANNCQTSVSAALTARSKLLIGVTNTTLVSCYGRSDGAVTVSTTGSVPVGTLLYSANGTSYQATPTLTGLAAGSYTLRLKDDLCEVTQPIVLTQPTALSAQAGVQNHVACWQGNDGTVALTAQGGTTPYQYSADGTTYQPAASVTGLPLGTFTYWVKDRNGCVVTTNPVSVTQPTALLLAVAARRDVRCYGGSDGVVSLTASGGTPGYRFSLPNTTFQASEGFTGLAAAAYTARVQDGHGCITSLSLTVGQPQAPFTLSLTNRRNLTCWQDNGGQLTVAGSGGTGPYQYALNNGPYAASNAFTGLAAGAYVVNGTDAQGCTATLTGQSLTEPDQVVVSLRNKLDVDCEYYTRGEAQVSAQGGQGSFVFSLTGRDILGKPLSPSPRTDGVFKALAAGNYEVTATDGSGCTGTYTVAIRARNSAIRFSLNAQPPASCQQATGQISVDNVTGGRPPYQYRIATQPSFSTSPQFGGLSAGSYLVTVADSLCAYTKAVSLDVAGSLSAAYTLTPRDCRTPNADIQVTSIQGGSGTYQLSLNGGAATTNRTFTNLLPGLYSIRVEDVPLSCPTVVSVEVVPQNGAGLRLAERQSVSCWQGSNGRLVFATENATGPFRFALDGGNPSSSSTFEGLTAGWHKLVVQNRLGCIDSMRVLITQPPLLQLATVARNNDCFDDQTGAVTASASGGVSPYQYSTDGVTYVSTTTLAGLKAGTYTVRVRDANGCVTPTVTTVSQPPLLTLQASYADTIRCFGESNGTVRLTVGGGTATYRYAIDSLTYGTDPLFSSLKTGTYTFWVSDAHSCRTKTQLALTQPAVLKLSLLGQANPLCYGDSSGKAQVLATGGNGGYQYYVNEGRPQASGQFSGLTQSRYGFRVIDRRGCTDTTARIQLSWPAPITSTFSTQQPRCYGESTGSVTVTLQGGTPPFQTTGPNRPATSPTFAFVDLTAGNYTLPFTDQHGCRYTLPVTLGQPTALSATTVMKPNDCFGDQTGQLTVTGQGATPPYRYGLTNPGSTDTTTQTAGVFARLRAGTYALRVQDAHGCLLQQSPAVNQPTKVTLQAIYADTVRCFGETNGRVRLLANGGVGGYRYTLDPTQAGLVDSLFTGLRAGPYQFWVNDQHGCRESASLTVTQPDRLKLTLTDRTDPRCAGDANGVIQVTSAGGNGTNTYWLDNARRQGVGRFDNLAQAEYTLKVVDRRGCEDTIRRVVLTWPKSLQASVRTIVPRCMGDANGAILTKVTGGVGSFSATLTEAALSTTGTDSLRFTNLSAGRYELAINDQHGCRLALPVTVSKPDPLSAVQLGDSSVVCKGQIVKLNAGNPGRSTAWYRDGQPIGTSQQIEAITPGLYRVVVTNATGCQTTAQYKLINSDKALDAEFLMAVQAFVGDTVYALNQSNPFPKTLHWELPAEAYALEKSLKQAAFVITTAGTYTIKLVAISEECQNQKERQIRIFRHEDIDQTDDQLGYKDLHIIDKVTVSPNPNYGKFRIQVDLSKVRDVEVLITRSANSALVYQHSDTGKLQYTFDVSLSNPAQDIYVVLIRAGTATYTQKLLIMH